MSEFEIDFEGPVAKYVLQPATDEEVKERQEWLPKGIAEAEWPLFLGRLIPSGKEREHRPKQEAMERAVTALVECKATPFHQVALTVARAVGALGWPGGDYVQMWHALAQRLRLMFEGKYFVHGKEYTWPQPEAQYKGDLGIFLVPGKDNKPMLALRPVDLQEALTLYAARMISTGTTFNICENCKTSFLSGGGRRRNKKRGDARFCSDECRWKWHNEERRKAR